MRNVGNIAELIGQTPMVKLNRMVKDSWAEVYKKGGVIFYCFKRKDQSKARNLIKNAKGV